MKVGDRPINMFPQGDDLNLRNLKPGDYAAWQSDAEVLLIQAVSISPEDHITGEVWSVPPSERYGSWDRRPWALRSPERVSVVWVNLLCRVGLTKDKTLDSASLHYILQVIERQANGHQPINHETEFDF